MQCPPGLVAVDKLPGMYAKNPDGTHKKWPHREGFERFNVCSGATGITKQLSPMVLGPIDMDKWGWHDDDTGERLRGVKRPRFAQNVENAWQSSKVFDKEEAADGFPTKEWYERRARLWQDPKGHRWVKKGKDKTNRNKPQYHMWGKSKKLSYLEARRRIYCPIYASHVRHTDAYKKLEKLHKEGKNLLLVGFDGYDRAGKSWKECFEDQTRPFGHEMVLAAMLEGAAPWQDTP